MKKISDISKLFDRPDFAQQLLSRLQREDGTIAWGNLGRKVSIDALYDHLAWRPVEYSTKTLLGLISDYEQRGLAAAREVDQYAPPPAIEPFNYGRRSELQTLDTYERGAHRHSELE
ncbi:hypothetical protein HY496_00195 [Candidatus Woesearchaeota archaeon]|nr:hypothetical protein [Candidatus Woesearchaeota archaeon]